MSDDIMNDGQTPAEQPLDVENTGGNVEGGSEHDSSPRSPDEYEVDSQGNPIDADGNIIDSGLDGDVTPGLDSPNQDGYNDTPERAGGPSGRAAAVMADDPSVLTQALDDLESFSFPRATDPEEDPTGRLAYRAMCEKIDKESFFRFPISSVVDKFEIERLVLDHCGLGDKGAQALAEALKINQIITEVSLVGNFITPVGGEFILAALQGNKQVKEVDFGDNRLGCVHQNMAGSSIGPLIRHFLQKNNVVLGLSLRSNRISDIDIEHIAEGLEENTTLTAIDFAYNEIGPRGGTAIARMLQVNAELKEINLEWNKLRAQGSHIMLQEGLMNNNTVKRFSLAWNGLDDSCGEVVGKIIFENGALEELDVSNGRIGVKGAEAIAKGIKGASSLKKLNISHNPLKDIGAAQIIASVRENNTLTHIDLQSCGGGPRATAEFQETSVYLAQKDLKVEVLCSMLTQ